MHQSGPTKEKKGGRLPAAAQGDPGGPGAPWGPGQGAGSPLGAPGPREEVPPFMSLQFYHICFQHRCRVPRALVPFVAHFSANRASRNKPHGALGPHAPYGAPEPPFGNRGGSGGTLGPMGPWGPIAIAMPRPQMRLRTHVSDPMLGNSFSPKKAQKSMSICSF